MLNTLPDQFNTWLRPKKKPAKNQWVMVSISFLLAVTLWFLVTMNTQTYSSTFRIPLKLINFPDSLQLLKEFPEELEVDTRGIGIELLYQRWEPEDTVFLDFNEMRFDKYFVPREDIARVSQVLQQGVSIIRVRPDTISLNYLRKANKRVPVVLDMVLNMPPAYRMVTEIKPNPGYDSVLIVGPADSLRRIDSWKTATYITDPIRKQQTLFIPMDTVHPFTVLPREILVTVEPRPYTEREMSVALKKVGLPRNTLLRLESDSVRVRFLLPMDDYDLISEVNFRIEADFNSIDKRSDYLIPVLQRKPASVLIQDIQPKLIRYTIIEQE